jgi:hypothetical protein
LIAVEAKEEEENKKGEIFETHFRERSKVT